MRCPDGVVGYIDFEELTHGSYCLPAVPWPAMHCTAHSTAIYLRQCGALEDAAPLWGAVALSPARCCKGDGQTMTIAPGACVLHRHLPQSRKLGRDAAGAGGVRFAAP